MFDRGSALLHDMGQLPWLVLLAAWVLAAPLAVLPTGWTLGLLFRLTGWPLFASHSCPLGVEIMVFATYCAGCLLFLLFLGTRLIRTRRLPGT
jgi:hypothetical protein